MKKYLLSIKLHFIFSFVVFTFLSFPIHAQNIRLKIERLGLRIFSPSNGVDYCLPFHAAEDDCGAFGPGVCDPWYPDPIVNNKLIINATDYPLPEFRGYEYITNYISVPDDLDLICLTGWTLGGWNFGDIGSCDAPGNEYINYPLSAPTSLYALWYTNNNFNPANNIDVQFAAYEDDNVICGGNDAWCGGWNSLRILSDIPNTINPCGEEIKDGITCTSDGTTRIWGLHYKVSWQWRAVQADEIDISKNICLGTNTVQVNTTNLGTLTHTNFQWQFSTDATNWVDIAGNISATDVDISGISSPQFVYVRKVKKGVICSGFPTPADEYSNICIINIRAAPTVAPTATKVPNFSGVCEATIENPIDEYNGVVPLTWEYQTSYDGITWSATQHTIPTLVNTTTTNVTGRIRFRASYSCGASPWRTYSWLLYPQPVAPTAIKIYPLDLPFVTNYTCSTDSMYVVFTPGYGGSAGSTDEYEYTTDGGTNWLPYTNGQKIRTTYGVGLSYGIRSRRTAPNTPGSGCNTSTPYKYYGYWTPYRPASSPTLIAKTPNVASFCKGAYTNVSATILTGSYGVPGNAYNQYEYSIDAGDTWQTYTSGTNISTTNAVDSIYIRVRRIDGNAYSNPVNICATDWNIIAAWRIIDPICDFTPTSIFCYNPNEPYIELTALKPKSPGVGTWSIVTYPATLSSTTSLTTKLTGLATGITSQIRWTVTESGCIKTKNMIFTPFAVSDINLTNGNTCQACPIRNGSTFRFYDNTAKLMAQIQDVSIPTSELSSTEVCVGIDAVVESVPIDIGINQPYLQRHFSISPTTNTSSNITLYFTAAEFNNLKNACNATPFSFSSVSELIVSKFPGGGNNIYTLPQTTEGEYIIPTTSGMDVHGNYFMTLPISTFSTFYIHSTSGLPAVLPIELTYFNINCTNGGIQLNWQTASEINNHHFEVEHSLDGISFKWVANIPASYGNSSEPRNYNYRDQTAHPVDNYYRLKQVDNDGHFSYSKIIHIDCNLMKDDLISIYPNPFTDYLNISLNSLSEETLQLTIYNLSGLSIKNCTLNASVGNNFYNIDNQQLEAGMYIIEIRDDDGILYKNKLLKQ